VAIHYLGIARMAARVDWQDFSQWGEQTWMLTGTPGEAAGDCITIYDPRKK
jgi:hypothetical protein